MAKSGQKLTRAKSRYLNPEYRKKAIGWAIRKNLGISPFEYELRKKFQGHLCAICREPMDGKYNSGREPTLDHNHRTGQMREFVHSMCNRGLGMFGENPVKLRLAAEYLEKHNE